MNVEQRIEIERKVVRHMIRTLKANGWVLDCIDNGDGEDLKVDTETEAMEEIFAVDEARVYFTKGGKTHGVFLVMGNDGYDVICDHSYPIDAATGEPAEFSRLMDQITDYASNLEV